MIIGCLGYTLGWTNEGIALRSGSIVSALGAPLAVFGTVATLGIDDGAGVKGFPHEVLRDFMGCLIEFLLVWEREEG